MSALSDPIISISGLGKKTSDRLNQLGIHTLEHLVFHLPSRYQDKTTITPLSKARVNDEILIELNIDISPKKYSKPISNTVRNV